MLIKEETIRSAWHEAFVALDGFAISRYVFGTYHHFLPPYTPGASWPDPGTSTPPHFGLPSDGLHRNLLVHHSGSRTVCLTMVFKLAPCAEKRWHRLNGQELIPEVIRGVKFVDGVKEIAA
jgi:hypothetical protein